MPIKEEGGLGYNSVGKALVTQAEDWVKIPIPMKKQGSLTHRSLFPVRGERERQESLWAPQVQLALCMTLRQKVNILKVALGPLYTYCSMCMHTGTIAVCFCNLNS